MSAGVTTTTVTYKIICAYSWVYDDDSPSGVGDHITNWNEATTVLDASSDLEAQLESLSAAQPEEVPG